MPRLIQLCSHLEAFRSEAITLQTALGLLGNRTLDQADLKQAVDKAMNLTGHFRFPQSISDLGLEFRPKE